MFQNLSPDQPIGVFDSGIGGLTVANAIVQHLPQEQLIYFGDTAHLPYGDKSADAIRYFSLKISKFLLERHCKMIVVACNSASSAAYDVLLEFFRGQALFVNVVDPLVEEVASQPFRKAGLIATKATVSSSLYQRRFRQLKPELDLHALATPLLVPMIEEGYVHNRVSQVILENYLSDPGFEKIEALMLACTHYPLIKPDIEKWFNYEVKVYDSTRTVAEAVAQKLAEKNLLSKRKAGPHHFFVSDYTDSFEETTRLFYPGEIKLEHQHIW